MARPKVLVIEDNIELCASLRAGYEEAGYDVTSVATVEAGLALLPVFAPSLVLLELQPSSLASQACLTTMRHCSDAAVIFLVSPEQRAAVPDALWQGASDCVVKPFHIRELIARTRAILRRRPAVGLSDQPGATRLPRGLMAQSKINPLLQ